MFIVKRITNNQNKIILSSRCDLFFKVERQIRIEYVDMSNAKHCDYQCRRKSKVYTEMFFSGVSVGL